MLQDAFEEALGMHREEAEDDDGAAQPKVKERRKGFKKGRGMGNILRR